MRMRRPAIITAVVLALGLGGLATASAGPTTCPDAIRALIAAEVKVAELARATVAAQVAHDEKRDAYAAARVDVDAIGDDKIAADRLALLEDDTPANDPPKFTLEQARDAVKAAAATKPTPADLTETEADRNQEDARKAWSNAIFVWQRAGVELHNAELLVVDLRITVDRLRCGKPGTVETSKPVRDAPKPETIEADLPVTG